MSSRGEPAHVSPPGNLSPSLLTGLREEIDAVAPKHLYPASIQLFPQGGRPRDVYFIERGLIKLTHCEQEGREMIVGLGYPGWMLGSSSVITQQPHLVTAETVTPSIVRRLPAADFLRLLETSSSLSRQLHVIHSSEISEHTARIIQLGCLTARLRLEQLLSRLTSLLQPGDAPRTDWVRLPLKHRELAGLIAVTPEHLSRILKQLQREGVVRQRKGSMMITSQRFVKEL